MYSFQRFTRSKCQCLARQYRPHGNSQRRHFHVGADAADFRAACVIWRVDAFPKVVFASADLEIVVIFSDVRVEISSQRISIQQALVFGLGHVEISIECAVDKFHFQNMPFPVITHGYQTG